MLWILIVPALLLSVLSVWNERRRALCAPAKREAACPRATLVVPVKGDDDGLAENLASLAAQDYPDFELIVTARVAADIPEGVLPHRARVVLAGSPEPGTSEKVRNLIAAVEAARPHSTVFAFADSDGRVQAGWLRSLVAPLDDQGVGASTGYRWYAHGHGFWALVRSAWNAVIFARFAGGAAPFAWGGSMAIHRDIFDAAHVAEFWKGAISDDYALTAAVHAAGLRIAFTPGATAVSTGAIGAREFFGWARRQLMITRFHNPRLWFAALGGHVLYCSAMLAALAAGSAAAFAALGVILAAGAWNAYSRSRLWRSGEKSHAALAPLITWIWLATLLLSAFGREIEWRGRRYRLSLPKQGALLNGNAAPLE